MLARILLLAGGVCLLGACASQNGEDLLGTDSLPAPRCDSTLVVTYALVVAPLLQQHCSSCHNSSLNSGGLDMSSYAQVHSVATNGLLLGAVNHDPGFPAMPQGGVKLSPCDINILSQWAAAGAPNN